MENFSEGIQSAKELSLTLPLTIGFPWNSIDSEDLFMAINLLLFMTRKSLGLRRACIKHFVPNRGYGHFLEVMAEEIFFSGLS